jgi:hypothetical protein
MTIDINMGRHDHALSPSIVVYEGDNNAGIPGLLFDVVEIIVIWIWNSVVSHRVLVLWLEQDDGAAIGDLGFGNYLSHGFGISVIISTVASNAIAISTHKSVAFKKAGSEVLRRPWILWSHPGKPPPEASALIYGPGRYLGVSKLRRGSEE